MTTTTTSTRGQGHDDTVLRVRGLRVAFPGRSGDVQVLRGIDLDARRGETIGIVGESGSGKSTTVLGVAGLLPTDARTSADEISFAGTDLLRAGPQRRRELLGDDIGVIYQDSLRALNPVMRIGDQIGEGVRARGVSRVDTRARVLEMLDRVGIPEPDARIDAYPHELSGGMRQRAVIAMALIMEPRLIIADEPTTALDVTVQAQILDLVADLGRDIGATTLLVTHDLGVVASTCDRVLVMYHGAVVEQGPVTDVFLRAAHPYTRALLAALPDPQRPRAGRLPFIAGGPPPLEDDVAGCAFSPRCDDAHDACLSGPPPVLAVAPDRAAACLVAEAVAVRPPSRRSVPTAAAAPPTAPGPGAEVLLQAEGVMRHYRQRRTLGARRPDVRAVDGVDLTLHRGETLGLVGESGCGKSTLGRILVGLEAADAGSIRVDGHEVGDLRGRALRRHRRLAQMVYQDPRSSLNRRMTVAQMLDEPLRHLGMSPARRAARVAELLELVGLRTSHAERHPQAFSGGQAQRIAIARALAAEPTLLVADESVASLDVSVQGQILNLLDDLRTDLGLTLLLISHDLGVVRQSCDRVAVMYLGQVVEVGPTESVFTRPRHPYTVALRSAIPVPDPADDWASRRLLLAGDPPRPSDPPPGCRFHPRCPIGPTHTEGRERCRTEVPLLASGTGHGSAAACHFSDRIETEMDA